MLVYDQTGALIYYDTYNGTANLNDRFYDITLDNQNNICVTGQTYTASNNSDYVTIKYSLNGVSSANEINNKADFLIYPNPATTEINIKGIQLNNGTIKIMDATGKVVFSQKAGGDFLNLRILTSDFKPGFYTIQLQNDLGSITKKLVIQ